MENWTLDDWLNDLDNCVKRGLYFEISGHSAGLLRDQIKKTADERRRVMWKKALMLVQLELGGYIVKQHNIYDYKSEILFAGSLSDCLKFLEQYMMKEGE